MIRTAGPGICSVLPLGAVTKMCASSELTNSFSGSFIRSSRIDASSEYPAILPVIDVPSRRWTRAIWVLCFGMICLHKSSFLIRIIDHPPPPRCPERALLTRRGTEGTTRADSNGPTNAPTAIHPMHRMLARCAAIHSIPRPVTIECPIQQCPRSLHHPSVIALMSARNNFITMKIHAIS
jgi:hypothetical protein